MEVLTKKSDCTGCGACQNICPKEAISMCHRVEVTYPQINQEKCVECGLCAKVCPVCMELKHRDEIYPIVYACKLKDNRTLKNSTSGGAFIALSKEILSKEGVVFGAVSGDDFRVNICSAENEDELVAMQGSKYVESNTNYSFRQVEEKLKEGRCCLYTALPCQIAGLLSYLEVRKANLENLYTADLVCHGTPSEVLYLSYLKEYERNNNVKLSEVRHRYKDRNWSSMVPQVCAYAGIDGEKDIHVSFKDGYLNGFLQGKIYKNNCYQCKYAQMPRIADITLADFTGLGAIKGYKNDYKSGVSQLLVNSLKGKELFDRVKNGMVYEERGLYEALFFNKNLWKSSKKPPDADNFLKDFQEGVGWEELRKRYLDLNMKNKRDFLLKELISKIFGANLTTKAMYYLRKGTMSPDEVLVKLDKYF